MATATESVNKARKAKAGKKAKTGKNGKKHKVAKNGEYGVKRSHDLPWGETKVAVFRALKVLKAISATTGCSALVVAAKAGVTPRDVRHYCYHAASAGLAGVATEEEGKGYVFYLTAKGTRVDLAHPPGVD